MNFSYTGRSSEGSVSGVLEAATAGAAADTLMARGVTPLQIKQASASERVSTNAKPAFDLQQWLLPKVGPVDLLLFSRQLHTLLKSGVPILRALAGLQESAPNQRMKQTLQQVRQSLGSGQDLSMAMAQHGTVFDGFYVALVRVGEMTGRLEEVFMRLFHHIEFEMFMGQQIKSALRYPMFVMIAMAAGIGVINVMVIPAFATVFKSFGAELPLATRILVGTSNFTIEYGWALVLGGIAGVWLLRRWVATAAGRLAWDRLKLRLPLAGKIIRKGMLARFARSFALSLKSGVPVEQALSVVAATVENAHIGQKIEGMRESVERGESILRAAAAAGVFTPIVLQMIAVGEETGAVDELMDEVAELYTNEVQYELKTLGQQIEPIMIIVLGVMVLVLALGVFLPVWDLGRVALKK
ncbi:MAG: type II secretion system F family protein [Burkholderiales bacterium]|nr:type II secretion system F family protein [Burkholderiales bacterium]